MMGVVRTLTVLALVLAWHGHAGAACSSATCTDLPAIENVRALVAAACDCPGVESHKSYVKCAKDVAKAAVRDLILPKQCKGPIVRCEGKSNCGKPDKNICCVVSKKGRVKAKQIRGDRCPSAANLCDHPMSLADACQSDGTCTKRKGLRSFRSVQRVFQTSCALPSCHSTFTRQGGLVLDSEDVSYTSLVGRESDLDAAKPMLRVKPGDPAASFLVKKLRGEGPGDPMPQATNTLPDPVIAMIEDWIARGAKSTAEECASPTPGGESLCDDDDTIGGDYDWEPLPPLDVPVAGEGVQLYMPPRPVAPGEEWETCYAVRIDWAAEAAKIGLPAGQLPIFREQVYRMHPGSHHLLLYAYFGADPDAWPTGFFPCVAANCINPGDCPSDAGQATIPIGGTQVAGTRYEVTYPQGVGIPVLGSQMVLIVNPHYTNPFQPAQDIYGEAWLNLYFHKPGEFQVVLDGIFAINFRDLIVEPYATRTISSVWQPRSILGGAPKDAAVFQLFGHMHKRATAFTIDYVRGGACSESGRACGRDDDCACKPWQNSCVAGQTCVRAADSEDTTIYYTTAWDQAPIVDFPKPYFLVDKDEGLRWTCTHANGVQGDPTRPPKRCEPGCEACGWDEGSQTCIFDRGVFLGVDPAPRVFQKDEPMPLVFGQLADDDMCNMFGYFIDQAAAATLP